MNEIGFFGIVLSVLLSTFRVAVPLVFTATGGLLSERSGVVNIALEGHMLVGAFAAATVATYTHSPWLGAAAGIAAGVALAVVYALFVIQFRADQIVAGTAINLLAFGVTPLLAKALFDTAGTTPALEIHDRFGNEPLYIALVVVLGIAFWFKHSRLGLWIGFAGEHPEALSTAGIRVRAVRWFSVLACGALAGMGGATLSIFLSSSFSRGMTAGRGFMALAALIFGKWKPIPALLACLFFGLTDALQIRFQGVPVFGDDPIPVQFIQILPYVFTVLVLGGFMGKSRPPKELGAPWLGVFIIGSFFFTQGCDFPLKQKSCEVAPASQTSSLRSPEAKLSQENAELLVEIMKVIYQRDAKESREFFQAYHSSLNQGASFEGVLNGMFHSAGYRAFEESKPQASSAARGFFVDELVRIQSELKRPLWIGPKSGAPLPRLEMPTGAPTKKEEVIPSFDPKRSPADYAKWFEKSSLPILSRVLSEAVMARLEEAEPSVSDWYSAMAARLGGSGVDFGLSQRNLQDPAFHHAWALDLAKRMPSSRAKDRVIWETLNRYLRILNHLNQEKK